MAINKGIRHSLSHLYLSFTRLATDCRNRCIQG
jgi:hypothetical protein